MWLCLCTRERGRNLTATRPTPTHCSPFALFFLPRAFILAFKGHKSPLADLVVPLQKLHGIVGLIDDLYGVREHKVSVFRPRLFDNRSGFNRNGDMCGCF